MPVVNTITGVRKDAMRLVERPVKIDGAMNVELVVANVRPTLIPFPEILRGRPLILTDSQEFMVKI